MKIKFSTNALSDCDFWERTSTGTYNRIIELINDIKLKPEGKLGDPKFCKGPLSGVWSRRINHQHRLLYLRNEAEITILAARIHHEL